MKKKKRKSLLFLELGSQDGFCLCVIAKCWIC
uniref:Uncharacterized protein n=1 Tax=Rhizophora mucronata TaxID=61149 RepID=A0A2P2NQB7_RHIMU